MNHEKLMPLVVLYVLLTVIITILLLKLLCFGKPTLSQGLKPKTKIKSWWVTLGGCSQGGFHDWVVIDSGKFCMGNDIGFGVRNSVTIGVVEKCKKCKKLVKYNK